MSELKVYLHTEHESNPLCIETNTPLFSWYLESQARGCSQTKYSILVTTIDGSLLWNSGEVASDEMAAIYAGTDLRPETTCSAKLTVWDNLNRTAESTCIFRTGLRTEGFNGEAWSGAKWIGTGSRDVRPEAMFVFELSCKLTLHPGSNSGGVLVGADDPRLMDRNKNILGIEAKPGESYVYFRLDTSPMERGENAVVEISRVGYATGSEMESLRILDIPQEVLSSNTRFEPHLLTLRFNNGLADIFMDGHKLNKPSGPPSFFNTGALNLNPAGAGNDYICFPALCTVGARAEQGQTLTAEDLVIRNFRQPRNVLFHAMETGETLRDGEIRWIDPTVGGTPMLRTEFSAKSIARAYLTITARGIYETYINGRKVGNDYFAPGLTQYNKTHMYQVYDVSDYIRAGDNALGIQLAEGWWSGMITFQGENTNFFGDVQSVLAKLVLEYPDGSRGVIVTDPDTFTSSTHGPISHASLFQGQVYNANCEISGWAEPGFNECWPKAVEIPLSQDNAVIGTVAGVLSSQEFDYSQQKCLGQIGNGVKCVEKLSALTVSNPRKGVYVYDFGQNIAGIPEIHFSAGHKGTKVTMRYAEVLYPELPEYEQHRGMIMVENLRATLATDEVILGSDAFCFAPQFTFHGFRYMEITGLEQPLPIDKVFALALSSAETITAEYHCSDEGVNRLFRNVCWSLRDNFISIPTDCPQRNERMGWSGDLSVFSRTAVHMTDCNTFLRRHLMAMRDLQREDGMFPDIAPIGGGFGGILWGSAGMTVAWESYLQYGDKRLLEEHYGAMTRYIDFLNAHVDQKTGLQTAGELGDWLGPQNGKTENGLLWMAYYVYDLEIMAKTAAVLGKPEAETYSQLHRLSSRRFQEIYLDEKTGHTVYSSEDCARGNRMIFEPIDRTKPLPPKAECGSYLMDTQTSYCVPMALNVLDEDGAIKAGVHLVDVCQRENEDDGGNLRPEYSLMTGFIGTAWILPSLTMAGRDDIAYRVLLNRQYPSWLYPVDQGATSIWERLDSYTTDRGFGGHNSMNSFNHYSFGAVGQWMITRSLGIVRETPGFRSFTLRPMPDEGKRVTEAHGWYLSPCGKIESSWKAITDGYEYQFAVPANTNCILELPGSETAVIRESGTMPESAEGCKPLGYNGGCHRFDLASGTYSFTVIN